MLNKKVEIKAHMKGLDTHTYTDCSPNDKVSKEMLSAHAKEKSQPN